MASYKGSRKKGSAPRHRGLGILFWLCLAAVVVAVAIAARDPLKAAFAQVTGAPAPASSRPTAPPQVTVSPLTPAEQKSTAAQTLPAAEPSRARPSAGTASQTLPPAAKPASRKARLYFITVDEAGKILMKSVIRSIPASDSPLRDTLDSLLKGPTPQELNLGFISMIPTDSRLLGVVMQGNTAVMDFSESFRFNAQGIDALNAQLRQVVYAATEFPSVKLVQIRIEGKTVMYLGTEGMRIDQPLTRASFQG